MSSKIGRVRGGVAKLSLDINTIAMIPEADLRACLGKFAAYFCENTACLGAR